MTPTRMYIDGSWVDAAAGAVREVLDPADGGVIAEVADGDRADAVRAVEAAGRAGREGPWPATTAAQRGELLHEVARAVEAHAEELAELETAETGKTLRESRWDMADVAAVFRYYAGLAADALAPQTLTAPSEQASSVLVREPIGVCGLPPIIEAVQVPAPQPGEALEGSLDSYFAGWSRNTALSVFFMGACYFVFKFLRYALDSWSPLAIEELFEMDAASAGYISTAFDWVGFLGVVAAGWASDRFFDGRRYQTIVLMTVGMTVAFVFLATFGVRSVWMFGLGLSMCGFMLMGPDSLLSGVGAIDVGGRNKAVVAAGIINGLGSIGPIFQEEIIGWVLDRHGYLPTFYLLIGVSALGVVGVLYLAHRSRQGLSSL